MTAWMSHSPGSNPIDQGGNASVGRLPAVQHRVEDQRLPLGRREPNGPRVVWPKRHGRHGPDGQLGNDRRRRTRAANPLHADQSYADIARLFERDLPRASQNQGTNAVVSINNGGRRSLGPDFSIGLGVDGTFFQSIQQIGQRGDAEFGRTNRIKPEQVRGKCRGPRRGNSQGREQCGGRSSQRVEAKTRGVGHIHGTRTLLGRLRSTSRHQGSISPVTGSSVNSLDINTQTGASWGLASARRRVAPIRDGPSTGRTHTTRIRR